MEQERNSGPRCRTRLFSIQVARSARLRGQSITLTSKYPSTGFGVEAHHRPFMLFPFLRELLGTSTIAPTVGFMTLLKTSRHQVTLFVCFSAESHIMFIMLVDLVLVLGEANHALGSAKGPEEKYLMWFMVWTRLRYWL